LRRDISDVSWAEFRNRLRNACEKHEREFLLVDPGYTTRTCNACGYVHDRPVVSMTFTCPWCGNVSDRPLNSAKNIRAKASPAERNVDREVKRAPQTPNDVG
jgi:putative transposase